MDGERAEIATGEFQRLNRETVRCDHDLAVDCGQRHGIGIGIEHGIGQMPCKQLRNELAHEAASIAVRQKNAFFHHCSVPA